MLVPAHQKRTRRLDAYLDAHNADSKAFIWTATVDQILAKVRRGRVALKTIAG
jgi:phage-related protein